MLCMYLMYAMCVYTLWYVRMCCNVRGVYMSLRCLFMYVWFACVYVCRYGYEFMYVTYVVCVCLVCNVCMVGMYVCMYVC